MDLTALVIHQLQSVHLVYYEKIDELDRVSDLPHLPSFVHTLYTRSMQLSSTSALADLPRPFLGSLLFEGNNQQVEQLIIMISIISRIVRSSNPTKDLRITLLLISST